MVAHVERCIRRERRQEVWTRRLELDSPVGHTKERQLLRIADERIDAVPYGLTPGPVKLGSGVAACGTTWRETAPCTRDQRHASPATGAANAAGGTAWRV